MQGDKSADFAERELTGEERAHYAIPVSETRPLSTGTNPRVCFVIPDLGHGSAEIVNMTLGGELLKRGYLVDFVTITELDKPLQRLPEGARHFLIPSKKLRYLLLPFTRYLARATRRRRRIVVADHDDMPCRKMASSVSRPRSDVGAFHAFRSIWSIASPCPEHEHRLELSARAGARRLSAGVADDLAELSGLRRERTDVVYNPISVSTNTDDAAAEAAWGGWKGPRILTVGRLKRAKNHVLLVHAFEKLLATRDARLMILGLGECAPEIANAAKAAGIIDKVLLSGVVRNPAPYYRSADLFVSSSDREGFGHVIVEAMACGLAVVSTDCKHGPAEILENGRYGIRVAVGDADALAKAIPAALVTEHDREALKQRAAEFAPERIADEFLQILFPKQRASTGTRARFLEQ